MGDSVYAQIHFVNAAFSIIYIAPRKNLRTIRIALLALSHCFTMIGAMEETCLTPLVSPKSLSQRALVSSKFVQRGLRMSCTILRLPEVKARTGLSRSTIYARVAEGAFPTPVSLGGRAVGWVASEVEDWLNDLIESRRPYVHKQVGDTGAAAG